MNVETADSASNAVDPNWQPVPAGPRSAISVFLRIPAKPITDSDLMAIAIPSDAERRRSEATLSCSYHAAVIGIRQPLCC